MHPPAFFRPSSKLSLSKAQLILIKLSQLNINYFEIYILLETPYIPPKMTTQRLYYTNYDYIKYENIIKKSNL